MLNTGEIKRAKQIGYVILLVILVVFCFGQTLHMAQGLSKYDRLLYDGVNQPARGDNVHWDTPVSGGGRRVSYDTIHYYFELPDGRRVYGSDELKEFTYDYRSLKRGDTFLIRYLPADPSVNQVVGTIYGHSMGLFAMLGYLGIGTMMVFFTVFMLLQKHTRYAKPLLYIGIAFGGLGLFSVFAALF